ncbi:hypothetical protein TSAR_013548 [Trichomalopsis sarcophagae]|uniref:Uncharacterized protein n=1 Tax=Trichomalopsis sarcophagae TaxID=543379 RepID=A0A232FJ40_9HYME|nr:hypothetical protein TSAR_013548 [Trichomalopsis sarcophagae]
MSQEQDVINIFDLELHLKEKMNELKWKSLQINCDVALKERESLLKQTHAAKLENMTLKLSVQQLTEKVDSTETAKKELEESLLEMRDRFSQVHVTFQSNVTKLEKEHRLILKSIDSVTKLNKRLQTVGLCTHAVYTKKNEEIKGLRKELAMKTQASAPALANQEFSYDNKTSKFDAKAYIEQIRLDLDNQVAADKEVEAFLIEFESDQ